MPYSNEEREKKRVKFAKQRCSGNSIEAACEAAGLSPSTFYAWNKDDAWCERGGWDKDNGWSKD